MTETNQRLKDLAVSDTGFVFDPYTGASFSTNACGLEILRAIKSGADRTAVSTALRDAFEVFEGEDDIERDIDEFIQILRRNHIVDADFSLE